MEWYERISFHRTCRGIGDGMQAKWIRRNSGSPSGDCSRDQRRKAVELTVAREVRDISMYVLKVEELGGNQAPATLWRSK